MGYFDDIRIEAEDSPEGKVVVFNVKEKQHINANGGKTKITKRPDNL